MSESSPTSKPKSKSSIKAWVSKARQVASKVAQWLILAFAFVVVIFLRCILAILCLLVGILLFFATLIIGSRRSGIIMERMAESFKKYAI